MPRLPGPGERLPGVPGYALRAAAGASDLHEAVREADGAACRVLLLDDARAAALADAGPALRGLSHPGLLPVLDVVLAPGVAAVVVPAAPGGSLRAHLDALPSLAPAAACALVAGLLDAVAAAHAAGAAPASLAPEDVLVVPGGAAPRLAVVPGPPEEDRQRHVHDDVEAVRRLLHELLLGVAAAGDAPDPRLPDELAAVLARGATTPAALAASLSALVPRLQGLPPLPLLPSRPHLPPPLPPEPVERSTPPVDHPSSAPAAVAPPVPTPPAVVAPAAEAPPAPAVGHRRRRPPARLLLAGLTGAGLVAGAVVVAAAPRSATTPPRAGAAPSAAAAPAVADPVSAALPAEPLPGGAVLSRTWELGLDGWHRLTGVLVVANPGTARVTGTATEVVPAAVAGRARDLDHGRAPSSWTDGDPVVVRWTYDVAAGETQRWRWGADVDPSADAAAAATRLDALLAARAAATAGATPRPSAEATATAGPSSRPSSRSTPLPSPSPAAARPAAPRPSGTRPPQVPAPAAGTTVVVDDVRAALTGTWVTIRGGVDGTAQQARRQGCSDRATAARWSARLAPGRWDVAVHLTGAGAVQARYSIGTGDGDVVAVLDQRERGWTTLLVAHPLARGDVRLAASGCGDGEAVADAVRFTYRGR